MKKFNFAGSTRSFADSQIVTDELNRQSSLG